MNPDLWDLRLVGNMQEINGMVGVVVVTLNQYFHWSHPVEPNSVLMFSSPGEIRILWWKKKGNTKKRLVPVVLLALKIVAGNFFPDHCWSWWIGGRVRKSGEGAGGGRRHGQGRVRYRRSARVSLCVAVHITRDGDVLVARGSHSSTVV